MISLRLVKSFKNAVTPFSLNVRYDIGDEHKCAVLFGPSGSGKSLTMQCLAGLTKPDSGHIRIGDCTLYDDAQGVFVSVQKRRIGYMFQDYALFPHLVITSYSIHYTKLYDIATVVAIVIGLASYNFV